MQDLKLQFITSHDDVIKQVPKTVTTKSEPKKDDVIKQVPKTVTTESEPKKDDVIKQVPKTVTTKSEPKKDDVIKQVPKTVTTKSEPKKDDVIKQIPKTVTTKSEPKKDDVKQVLTNLITKSKPKENGVIMHALANLITKSKRKKKVIVVFDIGKTNKKLLLFDENFQVVFQQQQKFLVTQDDDGFECDDIDLITSWIRKELEKLAGSNEYNPVSVNFSTYGASLMFVGKDGKRLTPVYNYMKEVSPLIAKNLFNQYGGENEFLRKAASPALGVLLNSGIQILWLKKEKPEIYKNTETILHFPQYLSYYLTGKLVSEPTSIGCHTFMWDYDNMCYNKWLADNDIKLPDPINDNVVFDSKIGSKTLKVGVGIHDSSASLVPYLLGSKEPFILVSTGTWCINMNPYNKEPLTADQLSQDCLCFMSPKREQVKSSRLFMGHFHDVWIDKLAKHFGVKQDFFMTVKYDLALIQEMKNKFSSPVFFLDGKESFDKGLKSADLSLFKSYEEAYTQLIIELTRLSIHAINLVIPENDSTKNIYISGGFAHNEIYVRLIAEYFSKQKIYTSEIDNSSALGAALVISQTFSGKKEIKPNLGLKAWH